MAALTAVAQEGDSLWSLTSRTLYALLSRPPTSEEVSTAVLTAQVPSGDFSILSEGDLVTYRLETGMGAPAAEAPMEQAAPAGTNVSANVSPPEPTSSSPTLAPVKQKMNQSGNTAAARGLVDFMGR